ncbi:hypothetical protein JW921_00390 [Candidatus Fermentibacterales bacterium]|nr:hypothetical protein [Candidatus Fermentibacterales bacterium]
MRPGQARSLWFASLLLSAALAPGGPPAPIFEAGSPIVDVCWSPDEERLFLLCANLPHLVIVSEGEMTGSADLMEVPVPGGMARIPGGGYYVSDPVGDRILRYDSEGGLLEEIPLDGRPTAIALQGIGLWCLLADQGMVVDAELPDFGLVDLEPCRIGRLACWRGSGLACCDGAAWLFSPGEPPEKVHSGGAVDAASWARGFVLLLEGEESQLLFLPQDSLVGTGISGLSGVAVSPSGRIAAVCGAGNSLTVLP